MKERWRDILRVPEQGKIRDDTILARATVAVIVTILCLSAMTFGAYAYFADHVNSGSSAIQSARFEATVTVVNSDPNGEQPTPENGEIFTVSLKAGAVYTVTLSYAESTAKTGYCILTAEGSESYHTQQLGADQAVVGGRTDSISFQLTVSEDTKVTIASSWGTSSLYEGFARGEAGRLYVTDGSAVAITVHGLPDSADENDETETSAKTDETSTETDAETESVTEDTTETTAKAEETAPPEKSPVTVHVVAKGETLKEIAKNYGTTVDRIVAYNGIEDPNLIRVGKKIKIPPTDWVMP